MTINQWITEARGRCEMATYECLCGLPGCSQCLADFEYERRARTDLPRALKALELLVKSLKTVADLGDECAQHELKLIAGILEGRDA